MGTTENGIYYPDPSGTPRREDLQDLAESVEDQIVGGLMLPIHARRARVSSVQSIANETVTKLAFNSGIVTDTNLPWDTDNSEFTAAVGGLYAITASAFFSANATGRRSVYIQVDGATVSWGAIAGHASQILNAFTGGVFRVGEGDTIAAAVEQNSGGALNVALASTGTFINIARVGR